MQDNDGIVGWVLAGVATVVSTLAGLVAHFYRTQISDYKANAKELKADVDRLTVRADACERDREELRVQCAVLETRVARIEREDRGSK